MPEFGQPLCVVPLLDSSATGYGCLVPPLRLSSNVPPSNGDKDLSGLYAACRSEKQKNRKPDTAMPYQKQGPSFDLWHLATLHGLT